MIDERRSEHIGYFGDGAVAWDVETAVDGCDRVVVSATSFRLASVNDRTTTIRWFVRDSNAGFVTKPFAGFKCVAVNSSDWAPRHDGGPGGDRSHTGSDSAVTRGAASSWISTEYPVCGSHACCPRRNTVTHEMKRTHTLALMIALIGGLALVGFAGSAAAQPDTDVDALNPEVDIDQDADADTTIETNQENSNSQTQVAASFSSSDESYATTTAIQGQDVDQDNVNVVNDVNTIAANQANDNEAENDFELDVRIGPPGQVFDNAG